MNTCTDNECLTISTPEREYMQSLEAFKTWEMGHFNEPTNDENEATARFIEFCSEENLIE